MDVEEMHVGVNLKLQEIASFAYDDLLPQEVDYYLNDAIIKFVDQRKEVLRATSDSVRSTDAWEDLRSLITDYTFVNDSSNTDLSQASGFPNALEASLSDLPDDYLHYISSRTKLSDGEGGEGRYVNNRIVKSEKALDHSYYSKQSPFYEEFALMITSTSLVIIPMDDLKDLFGPEITKVWFLYITTPSSVDIEAGDDSDLPDHTHDEIVDMAVQLMRQSLGASVASNE